MATSRLALYNVALGIVGERSLTSLTEDSEARRMLDEVWSAGNGAVRYCLEQGLWTFAMRAVEIDKEASITPSFGFTNAFAKPTDFVRLDMISADERFAIPLEAYEMEGNYFYADVDPVYLRIVSDDDDWGGDFAKWPETFTQWFGSWMAEKISMRLLSGERREEVRKIAHKALVDARSKDAQRSPTRFLPHGSWARARMGNSGGKRDRGSRSSLTG